MAAQRSVSAATRVIGPHLVEWPHRLGERGLLVATAGAPAGKSLSGGKAVTDLPYCGFVCNWHASARNHLCLWVKTCGPRKSISDLDGALRQP